MTARGLLEAAPRRAQAELQTEVHLAPRERRSGRRRRVRAKETRLPVCRAKIGAAMCLAIDGGKKRQEGRAWSAVPVRFSLIEADSVARRPRPPSR